ncbi:hypothetical protein L7F22_012695 [Adiantum nelumboides]|nr:hypothetical protein [Adiantum nelumboides]
MAMAIEHNVVLVAAEEAVHAQYPGAAGSAMSMHAPEQAAKDAAATFQACKEQQYVWRGAEQQYVWRGAGQHKTEVAADSLCREQRGAKEAAGAAERTSSRCGGSGAAGLWTYRQRKPGVEDLRGPDQGARELDLGSCTLVPSRHLRAVQQLSHRDNKI